MKVKLNKRCSHSRRLKCGRTVNVRECWVRQASGANSNRGAYRHSCPECGAEIISVRMPNGGWAHFEGQPGLSRIKHPCMHIGEMLGRGKDELTLDLFESANGSADA